MIGTRLGWQTSVESLLGPELPYSTLVWTPQSPFQVYVDTVSLAPELDANHREGPDFTSISGCFGRIRCEQRLANKSLVRVNCFRVALLFAIEAVRGHSSAILGIATGNPVTDSDDH